MKKLSISMTKSEIMGGWIYLFLQLLILPVVLVFVNMAIGNPLSDAEMNFVFFALNFICVTVIFCRFLLASLKNALADPLRSIKAAFKGLVLYYIASYLASLVIFLITPDFSNVNDENIAGMTENNLVLMSIGTVILVPPVEEVFYRGLIFQGLFHRSKLAAYLVSTMIFSAIHVVGYIGFHDPLTLLLCFLQYIPAGLSLGWAYARADSIMAPILIHITVNLIGISAMR